MITSSAGSTGSKRRTPSAILALCLLSFMSVLSAQDTLRNLTGTVFDHQHEPLRGAVVQVENETTHNVVSYITDRTGHYSFKRLQGNSDYNVWATYRDQRSKTKTLSGFNSHQEVTIDLEIDLR